jgi:hypothetical protein
MYSDYAVIFSNEGNGCGDPQRFITKSVEAASLIRACHKAEEIMVSEGYSMNNYWFIYAASQVRAGKGVQIVCIGN